MATRTTEERYLNRRIRLVTKIVESGKQRSIKLIVRRLNEMSPADVMTLSRLLK